MTHKLNSLLDQIEKKIPLFESLNQQVSQATVGWHIEHTLLSVNKIIQLLINSKPEEYKWKFNSFKLCLQQN